MSSAVLQTPGLAQVLAALPEARLVGGAVRDALAGLPVADIDLASPAPPDAVIRALEAAGLRAVPTGLAHGTITAVSEGRPFEITSLRRDDTTDGRHAAVSWTDDWRQDAGRRDFTINAMSMDRAGQVFDYFGGRDDLAAGRVVFVGDAAARVAEDYLRILRFFRFVARYQIGAPDPRAVAAVEAGIPGLAILSAERVWSELKRILAAPDPVPAVRLMRELGVLAAILPEGAACERLADLVAGGAPPDAMLRLAALLTGSHEAVSARLKLSSAEAGRLAGLRTGGTPRPGDTAADLRRMLADEPAGMLIDRTWLAGPRGADWVALRERLAAMTKPVFPLVGRDAIALGAAPGPHIGAALRETRAWWLQGGCTADPASLRQHLAAILGVPFWPRAR